MPRVLVNDDDTTVADVVVAHLQCAGLEAVWAADDTDDYVTKPCTPRELVLRLQSLLRRTSQLSPAGTASTAGAIPAAPPEFDRLAWLVSHPGRVFTRTKLMSTVWGWELGDQFTVTMDVRRLREKVEPDPSTPARLVTVFGVGYRWDPAALDREGC